LGENPSHNFGLDRATTMFLRCYFAGHVIFGEPFFVVQMLPTMVVAPTVSHSLLKWAFSLLLFASLMYRLAIGKKN
jgi:hypothetical protein